MRAHPFVDPITGMTCTVHISDANDPDDVGIEHPACDYRAEVAPELDAFYCRECRYSGRISGAWFVELLEEANS